MPVEKEQHSKELNFDPDIPGLDALLLQSRRGTDRDQTGRGFSYFPEQGLRIVLYGPTGAGKTILALQMAFAAAKEGKRVIYLTKDTPAQVLHERIAKSFEHFGTERTSAKWNFSNSSSLLSVGDIEGLISFADKLKSQSDPVSELLWSQFSDATHQKVSAYTGTSPEDASLRLTLVRELNQIIQSRSLYQKRRFAGVTLSKETQSLLDPDAYGERLIRLNRFLIEDAYPSEIMQSRRRQENPNEIKFVFLNEILNEASKMSLDNDTREPNQDVFQQIIAQLPRNFFAFADFGDIPASVGSVDRYLMTPSVYHALAHLQPELQPVFHEMAAQESQKDPALFIVCDSLSPSSLEENLHLQASYDFNPTNQSKDTKPIFLFIMESEVMPQAMSVAFPPDIQIALGMREEPHNITTRTIQLVKTRFQKSIHERAPFVIVGKNDSGPVADECEAQWDRQGDRQGTNLTFKPPEPKSSGIFGTRDPGIEIMAPLAHEAANLWSISKRTPGTIRFCIEDLDQFTKDENLAGGGCTLLITQNRCGSTALSLHYLLGQIGEAVAIRYSRKDDSITSLAVTSRSPKDARLKPEPSADVVPKSVLYIGFSDDVEEILHTIWQYPSLRQSFWQPKEKGYKLEEIWEDIRKRLKVLLSGEQSTSGVGSDKTGTRSPNETPLGPSSSKNGNLHGRHRLYKFPLLHQSASDAKAYLYVYIPDFSWITAEEAMKRVVKLLESDGQSSAKASQIDRIVLDRVGRVQARWPLVENSSVFISTLVALCTRHHIELMVVDDTAEEEKTTGILHSRWMSTAQNVIRLRRIPFHGTETITIELISAGGRITTRNRPYEVVFRGDAKKYAEEMAVEDSFRGYTALATGEPVRCKVKVDLSYDLKHTPLYYEVLAIKQNLETAMDAVEVKLLGHGEWSGINSAFHNLSGVSRDTCHIVAIDGIWLESLLRNRSLHRLSIRELWNLLPEHIRKEIAPLNASNEKQLEEEQIEKKIENNSLDKLYVTESITTALEKISHDQTDPEHRDDYREGIGNGLYYAIPMRHNWGVLAVSKLSKQLMVDVFNNLCEIEPPGKQRVLSFMEAPSEEDPEAWTKLINELQTLRGSRVAILPEVIRGVMAVLLGWEYKETDLTAVKRKAEKNIVNPIGKIHKAIWGGGKDLESLSWQDIAHFRTDWWHPFWKEGWVYERLEKLVKEDKRYLWIGLFPRIDLFGLATSKESIVSFLLELLLANVRWETLFGQFPESSMIPLLTFQTMGPLISPDNFSIMRSFADRLQKGARDSLAGYLWGRFSSKARKRVSDCVSQTSDKNKELRQVLDQELNRIIRGKPIYDTALWSGVNLSKETRALIGSIAHGERLPRLNRLLLEDAFPQEIAKSNEQCLDGFTDTLILFYRLLSQAQRRQLGIGLDVTQSEIGTGLRDRLVISSQESTTFEDWPRQISLFSREWITSVQDPMPRHDIRESVKMMPLPKGDGDATATFWNNLAVSPAPNYGPTVAGTWYLGILKGGNTDLGTDVMKVILAKEHEFQRLVDLCGAPVSKEFYKEEYLGLANQTERNEGKPLPYAEMMNEIYVKSEESTIKREPNNEEQNTKEWRRKNGRFFPFYRTQIVDYLEVSDILYDLVRQVMRLSVKDEEQLEAERVSSGCGGLKGDVKVLAKKAFGRLNALQDK